MSKKSPIVFPWRRQGFYFGPDSFVTNDGLTDGHWSKLTKDVTNDGVAEVTTTRTRDAKGRVVKVDIVDARDAAKNKTIVLSYDDQGRVVTYDLQAARPRTLTYQYDAHDHLIKETAVSTDLQGGQHTFHATHKLDAHGAIAATIVTNEAGKKTEERHYTPAGELKALTNFNDAGEMTDDEQVTFDSHNREIKRVSREFTPDPTTGKLRLGGEAVEETSYQHNTPRPARKHRVEHREFEKSTGVFVIIKINEETTTYAPPGGGVEHSESHSFMLGTDGQLVEFGTRIEDTTFDSQDRKIASKESNHDINTGESKTARSVTTYCSIMIETTDLGADGVDDEESVTITDEANHVVASRTGKPRFGPFTQRQEITYDAHGEVVKRLTYKDNADTPASVEVYS